MATEDLFIVAIELGSSNVTGIAGKKMPAARTHPRGWFCIIL